MKNPISSVYQFNLFEMSKVDQVRLAIVGTRSKGRNDYQEFLNLLKDYISRLEEEGITIISIVTGDASGIDSYARRYAKESSLHLQVFKADWSSFGRAAGPMRNTLIVKNSDILVAFWDGESPGTKNSILQARKRGMRVDVLYSIFESYAV